MNGFQMFSVNKVLYALTNGTMVPKYNVGWILVDGTHGHSVCEDLHQVRDLFNELSGIRNTQRVTPKD
jgi:hypothetical protein